jgi:hypothetical protein
MPPAGALVRQCLRLGVEVRKILICALQSSLGQLRESSCEALAAPKQPLKAPVVDETIRVWMCPAAFARFEGIREEMHTPTKPVIYRGGLVSLRIPATWREEYEPDGGGTFYEEGPDTGTLRLNVLTLKKEQPRSLEEAIAEVFHGDTVEMLSSGFPMRRYLAKGEERGTPLHLHRWEILVPVSPYQWRLACFTLTILAALDGNARSKKELAIVDKLVHEAEYSIRPGMKLPWWRAWSRKKRSGP